MDPILFDPLTDHHHFIFDTILRLVPTNLILKYGSSACFPSPELVKNVYMHYQAFENALDTSWDHRNNRLECALLAAFCLLMSSYEIISVKNGIQRYIYIYINRFLKKRKTDF
jgi:hypothetical protein